MNENHFSVTKDDLHALADGRLTPERAEEVKAYLRNHPARAAEVEDYRRINRALGVVFDSVLEEPIPAAQIAVAQGTRPRLAAPLVAAAAGLVLGVGLTWFAQGFGGGGGDFVLDQLAEKSAAAYAVYAPEVRHPVEVAASEAEHLSAWLSNRMGMAFRIPRLGDLGFELIGGRLMIGDRAPAALLMYENSQGRRLIFYLRNDLSEAGTSEPRYVRSGETGVVTWFGDATGFGLAGAFVEDELLPVAQSLKAQLSS